MIKVEGLCHVDIMVKDLDEYVDFLRNKFGLEVIRKHDSVEFRTPAMETIIEVHQTPPFHNPEINHITFRVRNIQKAYEDLKNEGVEFSAPPKYFGPTGRWFVNTRFPDGRRLQLSSVEPPPKQKQ